MLENTDRALYSRNYRENANHTGVPTCGLEIIRKQKKMRQDVFYNFVHFKLV